MSNHLNFLAEFGTPRHHDKMAKTPHGRSVLSATGNDDTVGKVADKLSDMYHHTKPHAKYVEAKDISAAVNVIKHGGEHAKKISDTYLPKRYDEISDTIAHCGTDSDRDSLVNHPAHRVRMTVAMYGNDSHREKLMNDDHMMVRANMAESPKVSLEHLKKLSTDPEKQVSNIATRRLAIKAPSMSNDDLGSLVDHHNGFIRHLVAKHGDDSHRDKLVNDEDWHVRHMVAKHGNVEHAKQLVNDQYHDVRTAAKEKLESE